MPRIRRRHLSRDLWSHLLARVKSRHISVDHLGLLADWLAAEPEVPHGKWFKRFPGMILCGESELIRTFLQAGQAAMGDRVLPPVHPRLGMPAMMPHQGYANAFGYFAIDVRIT